MAAIDFITALGRVLQDGALRDAFALDPLALARRLDLRERDQPLFLQLDPADLEFQARVLVRKRFVLVMCNWRHRQRKHHHLTVVASRLLAMVRPMFTVDLLSTMRGASPLLRRAPPTTMVARYIILVPEVA